MKNLECLIFNFTHSFDVMITELITPDLIFAKNQNLTVGEMRDDY